MVWLFWGGLLVVGGGFATFYVMRALKGSIRLYLASPTLSYGQPIEGNITIRANKPIQSTRLVLTLRAEEIRRYRDRDHDEQTSTHEVYRKDFVLAGNKVFAARESQDIPFSLPGLPAPGAAAGGTPGLVGSVIQAGFEMMAGQDREMYWELIARLDCPGVDLVCTEPLVVMPF